MKPFGAIYWDLGTSFYSMFCAVLSVKRTELLLGLLHLTPRHFYCFLSIVESDFWHGNGSKQWKDTSCPDGLCWKPTLHEGTCPEHCPRGFFPHRLWPPGDHLGHYCPGHMECSCQAVHEAGSKRGKASGYPTSSGYLLRFLYPSRKRKCSFFKQPAFQISIHQGDESPLICV